MTNLPNLPVPVTVTDEERRDALALLKRARTVNASERPFWTYCSWRLRFVETLSLRTLATNGQDLFYNPKYVSSLRTPQSEPWEYAESEVAHEVAHCVFGDCQDWSLKGYDNALMNQACDFRINGILKDEGFRIHPSWLYDERFRRQDKTWMDRFEIYAILEAERQQQGQKGQPAKTDCTIEPQPSPDAGSGDGDQQDDGPCPGLPPCDGGDAKKHKEDLDGGSSCSCPHHADEKGAGSAGKPGGDGDGKDEDKPKAGTVDGQPYNNWDRIVVEAAKISQSMGKCPGFAEQMVDDIIKPKLDYKAIIEKYMSRLKRGEFSFRRLNKRYIHTGLAMPSLHGYTANCVVAIDTSGSCYGYAPEFLGHCWAISKATGVPLWIIQGDAAVSDITLLKKADDARRIRFKGGGGTDFRPIFEALDKGWKGADPRVKKVQKPDLLIFLTDGIGTYPERRPKYDTLWVIPGGVYEGYKPPFGKILIVPAKK